MSTKKVLIFCSSYHTSSTLSLLQGIQALKPKYEVKIIHLETNASIPNISEYDFIGFASGIYYGKSSEKIYSLMEKLNIANKSCFSMITAGYPSNSYKNVLQDTIKNKRGIFLGGYICKGHDLMMGDLNPGHPNNIEKSEAKEFLDKLVNH